MTSIHVHHNHLKGFGNAPEGFQIGISQRLFGTSPVTGGTASGVKVDDNEGFFPAHTHNSTVGLLLERGLVGGSASRNHFKGFRSLGIRKLGVQGFTTCDNTFEADPTVTALAGVQERSKDTTLHIDSKNNKYSGNVMIGTFSREIIHSDETCYNSDRKIVRRTGAISSDTIIANTWPRQVIYTNHNANAAITLDASVSSPWPIDSDVVITNAHATNSLVVNGVHTVAPGTSLRLVCSGGNVHIKAN
jgi:hypothetical protein